jgi:hypothetical protein
MTKYIDNINGSGQTSFRNGRVVSNDWVGKMISSYRSRNSHIPDSYFDAYIRPFLKTKLTDIYFKNNFGSKTVADWFMVFDIRGTIRQFVWGTYLENEKLRWDIGGNITNENAIYNTTYTGMIIVSSVSSFDTLITMNFENEAGGGLWANANDLYGYMPYHEHPKTVRMTLGFTYQTGALPWSQSHTFPELIHLCTNSTNYTSVQAFVAPKMIEIYLNGGLYNQEYPLFDFPLLQTMRAYGITGVQSFYGQVPFANKTLNSLTTYLCYQSGFTTGLELVDFHNATTVQGYNTNYTNHTFPNINAGSNLRDIRFDNCGFTDFTAQTFNNQMTMVSMRTNAIPTSGIDRIVATCYNGGAYRGTGATYRMNSGTNGTPGGTAQTQITEMRGAGATFTVNGF